MPEIQASRRLVKSPPELWAEVSDAASLARHLGEVGEIRITRLEPETTVAWEGETASGTVALAPAGWGTSVTLTAEPIAVEPIAPEPEPLVAAEPEPALEPEPAAETEAIGIEELPAAGPEPRTPEAEPRRGWFARLFKRRTAEPERSAANADPEPSATDADRAAAPPAEPVVAGETTSAAPPAESPSPATGPARQAAEPEPEAQPHPWEAVLTQALDSLGQAHHRPFSRG
jgi:hypothetical protein